MPLKVNSSIHHSEAEKVQVTPKGTQRTLLHYLSSILYLHIQKNFYPSESLRLEGFFDKTTEEKLKAGCTPAVVTISQTCYKITFFNWKIIAGFFFQIATLRHFTYCQQTLVGKGLTYRSRRMLLYSLYLFRTMSLHFCVRIMLIII